MSFGVDQGRLRDGAPSNFAGMPGLDSAHSADPASTWTSSPTSTPIDILVSPPFGVTRLVDLVLATLAIVFLAPLLAAIAVLIWTQDGGRPVFGHERVGWAGRRFKCWKFRSMVMDADARLKRLLDEDPDARREWEANHKLRRDPRITPLGEFLRRSSLDELPQLFNVISGDMSLVGPRPIVNDEIAKYGRQFRHYCRVRPGITGLWQVSGRNDLDYRRRVALDVLFVRAAGPWLYMLILARTVPAVLLRKGSY